MASPTPELDHHPAQQEKSKVAVTIVTWSVLFAFVVSKTDGRVRVTSSILQLNRN
jgi:hypothetical protein